MDQAYACPKFGYTCATKMIVHARQIRLFNEVRLRDRNRLFIISKVYIFSPLSSILEIMVFRILLSYYSDMFQFSALLVGAYNGMAEG